jgi:hypothetical protein
MTAHLDVAALDRQLQFIQEEQTYLRKQHADWADRKHRRFEEIAETLRSVRREKQMTGIGGRRIE